MAHGHSQVDLLHREYKQVRPRQPSPLLWPNPVVSAKALREKARLEKELRATRPLVAVMATIPFFAPRDSLVLEAAGSRKW